MSSEVVHLPGAVAPPDSLEPVPSLVEGLEKLLQMARSGQLREICATGFLSSGSCVRVFTGPVADRFRSTGAVALLLPEFHSWLEAGSGEDEP